MREGCIYSIEAQKICPSIEDLPFLFGGNFLQIKEKTINDTQENQSNKEIKGVDPVKLEWRSYESHYKCDVNINDVVSYWCFACENDYFVL